MGINIQYKWVRHTGPQSLSKIMGGALSWASWTVRIWGLGLGAPPFCHSHNHHHHLYCNRASKWQALHGVVGYIFLCGECPLFFFHTHCVQDRLEGGRSSLIQGAICGLPESSVRLLRSAGTQRTLISGPPGSTKSWSQVGQLQYYNTYTAWGGGRHTTKSILNKSCRENWSTGKHLSRYDKQPFATLFLLEVGFIIFWSERLNMKDWSDSGWGPNWIAASRVNL